MATTTNSVPILMADDDEEDCMLAQDSLTEAKLANELHVVSDGEELLQYLRNEGRFGDIARYRRPGLILLDLNMPKVEGRQALAEIRADDRLKDIPVIVMTTSQAEEDVIRSYATGANSYITKPVSFEGLVEVMQSLERYWFQIVCLPNAEAA
ncbi:MAG: response regulator [Chloroflexi bacterium]|nr:response regulator [Chloroflexota bacterium]MDA1174192.1 response regulator [Chloroflexota bacterium]